MSTENTEILKNQDSTTNEQVTEQAQQSEDKPWYSNFGYEDEDSFKSDFEQMRSLKDMANEIQSQKAQYENYLGILNEVNEDPDPEILTLSAFKKKGIDINVATQILNINSDDLDSNPLKALVLSTAATNPDAYKKLGIEGIEQAIKEKYKMDDDDAPTASMKLDAIRAIDDLNKIKSDVANVKNPYKFASELKQQKEADFVGKQQKAEAELKTFVSKLNEVEIKQGDDKFPLKVSSEEINAVLNDPEAKFLGYFDVSTKEGKQAIKTWVEKKIINHKLMTGDLVKSIREFDKASIKKEVVKEVHNGKEVSRSTADDTENKELTATQKYLISMGKTPYSLQK